MRILASSSNSTVTVNFALSTPKALRFNSGLCSEIKLPRDASVISKRWRIRSESGGRLCWGCDKKQLLLNDSNVKQAAGDICQHSGGEELQIVLACR